MSDDKTDHQRPPAEVRFAGELDRLREDDTGPRPPGWALSLTAARRFITGDETLGIGRKFVGDTALIDRALVTLATSRGLMLVGEPGTAKTSRCCSRAIRAVIAEPECCAPSTTSTPTLIPAIMRLRIGKF